MATGALCVLPNALDSILAGERRFTSVDYDFFLKFTV